ncbi:MAG: DUF5682 family protein [Pseudomonadota bacterium]
MSDSPVHYFGIRHHGPGCARSLRSALQALQPDCILVEGPPDADALLPFVVQAGMEPPVALLVHSVDDADSAVFYPFAAFSPEWQALQFGQQNAVPTRFIDLPQAIRLAQEKLRREEDAAENMASDADGTGTEAPKDTEAVPVLPPLPLGEGGGEGSQPVQTSEGVPAPQALTPTLSQREREQEGEQPQTQPESEQDKPASLNLSYNDPLDALAHAAGFADGESWWNHLVEERGDGEDIFVAIAEAMAAVRDDWPPDARGPHAAEREMQREAHMRQCVREAVKAGHQRIAVVCGAWHVPALQASHTAKADAALLKGLPKTKVSATWVPWTYRHLTFASGYGAGVEAPGWYDFLWSSGQRNAPGTRASGWLARVARLLRENNLDCSSAHVIEATRLADTLAALRGRAQPGMGELDEAVRGVMSMGDGAALQLIHKSLTISDRMGHVPPEVPAVPLQRDIEQSQKSLRLKPEALERTLELDLRQASDLAKSHLLHRLRLLGINWGDLSRYGRSNRGTFRETWQLQWQPEFAVKIIEASRFGATLVQAATARVAEQCATLTQLDELAELVDVVLLADLGEAVNAVSNALQAQAAITGDALQLIAAVPPLAKVFRYGSVRQTDSALLAQVLDGLITRGAIGLPLACQALDESAAEAVRGPLLATHDAIALRDSAEHTTIWQQALQQIAVGDAPHALLRGLCCRLLLDAGRFDSDQAATQLSRQLSAGASPLDAAQWLDGFLNRNALVLLHDNSVWQLVDQWLADLSPDHFMQVVPLVRRSFAGFSGSERRDLGARAARDSTPGKSASPADAAAELDATRAAKPVATLRLLLGLPA